MDAFAAFKIEDFQLIRIAIEEGRPVLIAVNKW
jgi:predicted GTPase